MDASFDYYTTYYARRYARLKNYYADFRSQVEAAEQDYQDSNTASFEQYMTKFDNVDPPTPPTPPAADTIQKAVLDGVIPESVDWTAAGMVTPVKNQGGCGSCWAFSTQAMLESMNLMQKGTTINLSE